MEFWEGAVLIVGGVWLVGKMTKRPVFGAAPSITSKVVATPGLTTLTNTAGTPHLVAGEPLTPAGPMIPSHAVTVSTPVGSAPIKAPITPHYVPTVGGPMRARFYPL